MDGMGFSDPQTTRAFFCFFVLVGLHENDMFCVANHHFLLGENGWHSVGVFHSARDAMFIQQYLVLSSYCWFI